MSAERRVFRGSPVGYAFGAFFALAGLAFTIGVLVAGFGEGIRVNGVLRTDAPAVLGCALFTLSFFLIGTAIVTAVHFSRIETDESGIKIYNWLNRATFDQPWGAISSYQRVSQSTYKPTHWSLSAGTEAAKVPHVNGEIHRLILTHISPSAWPTSTVQPQSSPTLIPETTFSLKSGGDLYIMFFSVIWYTFLAGFTGVFLFQIVNQADNDPTALVIFPICIIGFASIMYLSSRGPWRRFLTGKGVLSADRIMIQVGRHQEEMYWSDLIMVEEAVSTHQREGGVKELNLVAREHSIQILSNYPRYRDIRYAAFNLTPTSTVRISDR